MALALAASAYSASACGASWYGYTGRTTANGERYNGQGMTAAHRSLPFGTRVSVTWGSRSVVVTINDRGPFIRGRCIDLSAEAARRLGTTQVGVADVRIVVLYQPRLVRRHSH